MSVLFRNDTKNSRRLRTEKEQIIEQFKDTYLKNRDEGAFAGMKNMIMNTMTSRVVHQNFNDGSSYEGEIHVDGQRNGKGIMYLNNGDVYCGNWRMGNFDGYGTYIFANGER